MIFYKTQLKKNLVIGHTTLAGSDGALPPDPALLVCGDSAPCQNLQLDQAGADKEVDDWVQVDLKLGGSSRWRQRPGGNLRQARPVVRSRFVNFTISGTTTPLRGHLPRKFSLKGH